MIAHGANTADQSDETTEGTLAGSLFDTDRLSALVDGNAIAVDLKYADDHRRLRFALATVKRLRFAGCCLRRKAWTSRSLTSTPARERPLRLIARDLPQRRV